MAMRRRRAVARRSRALARRDGQIEVHEGMLGSAALERESFDLVSIMHVFEHVPRPSETLRADPRRAEARRACCSSKCRTRRTRTCSTTCCCSNTCIHFTPETLAWLLSREGFEVVVHQRSTSYGAQRVIARKAGRPPGLVAGVDHGCTDSRVVAAAMGGDVATRRARRAPGARW